MTAAIVPIRRRKKEEVVEGPPYGDYRDHLYRRGPLQWRIEATDKRVGEKVLTGTGWKPAVAQESKPPILTAGMVSGEPERRLSGGRTKAPANDHAAGPRSSGGSGNRPSGLQSHGAGERE